MDWESSVCKTTGFVLENGARLPTGIGIFFLTTVSGCLWNIHSLLSNEYRGLLAGRI